MDEIEDPFDEPVDLEIWRGEEGLEKISAIKEYDDDHYLIKEEVTHYGETKLILKEKATGRIIERVNPA